MSVRINGMDPEIMIAALYTDPSRSYLPLFAFIAFPELGSEHSPPPFTSTRRESVLFAFHRRAVISRKRYMGAALSRKDSYEGQDVSAGPAEIIGLVTESYLSGVQYSAFDNAFITAIVVASFISALSVLMIFLIQTLRPTTHLGDHTHILALFGSLLLSNLWQAVGTILNTQWVIDGGVTYGSVCRVQGGIKQTGNVGAAFWSFMLSLHAFRLLFLRHKFTQRGKWLTLGLGWAAILLIVLIGPFAIQNKDHGPYFGPSGFWCWITDEYPAAQTFLEYFFEWVSAFLSSLLYSVVLLRVRGNLVRGTTGKWALRWVQRGESWQLSIGRDYLDSSMIHVATIIVWYPVAYTVLITPITAARFAGYAGLHVPQGFTFTADLIFGLGGFANLILLLATRRFFPDLNTLPDLSTPRARLDKDSLAAVGITPFVLPLPDIEKEASGAALQPATDSEKAVDDVDRGAVSGQRRNSVNSMQSVESFESTAPLTARK
ncbi:hypothetical protein BV25DRAFT_1913882 [Artomyces pyxidatus]|uniref:Uncharacterized protein n=1 Tax=Artomyces pyxidatus TaxID=48021 RepID=A0ACB8TAS9_9AGAM|nr:hypothetical protein BV25DRAFT_1913882 [Artomyces pyxidatus]